MPNIYIGSTKIKNIYAGTNKIKKVYFGNVLIFGRSVNYQGTATALSVTRSNLTSANVGNYLLFAGGDNSGRVTTVDAYNTSLVRSNPTSITYAVSDMLGASNSTYAVVAGGFSSSGNAQAFSYLYNTSLVQSTGTQLNYGVGYGTGATVGNNEYAVLAGGSGKMSDTSYSRTYVYAYNTSAVMSTAQLSSARADLAGASVGGIALFAGGGNTVGTPQTTVDCIDSSIVRTTLATGLSSSRKTLCGTIVGNYAIFGGGSNSAVVDAFDSSLVRTIPTTLSVARQQLKATSLGDFAIFGGGYASTTSSSVVDIYDTSLVRTTSTSLTNKVYSHSAGTIGDYALFAGGFNTSSKVNTVDVYALS